MDTEMKRLEGNEGEGKKKGKGVSRVQLSQGFGCLTDLRKRPKKEK
jgi:hypothetical protein